MFVPESAKRPATGLVVALGLLLGTLPVSAATPPQDGWRIQIDASLAGVVDKGRLTLGASTSSVDGFDSTDDPEPPARPNRYLDLSTHHTQSELGWETQPRVSMRYRAEYGTTLGSTNRPLDFVIETDQAGPFTLTWAIHPDLDLTRHFLTLYDLDAATSVDMWQRSSYSATATPGLRHFRMELRSGRSAPPQAQDQAVTTAEDIPVPIALTATDAENDPLTFRVVAPAIRGTLLGVAPSLTYMPAPNFNGPDSFTFVANDGQSDSNEATVTITVQPVNDAPVATDQSLTTDEDVALPITLAASDVDGDPLVYTIVTPPAHGVLSGTGPTRTYTPAANWGGSDSFAFKANDGTLDSNVGVVSIVVNGVNDPPLADFTVPGPEHNVATWDNNLASYYRGASVVAQSSSSAGYGAENAINESTATYWLSANGSPTNQFLTVLLPGGTVRTIDRVRLTNLSGSTQAVKHFQVLVSTTGLDDTSFAVVLDDLAVANDQVQEFVLLSPVQARYVKFLAKDNYGSACCTALKTFEAIDSSLSGIPSGYELPPDVASATAGASIVPVSGQTPGYTPEAAIDGNPGTYWYSASGQVTNQALVVQLARGKTYTIDRVRLSNGAPAGYAVKDFQIAVSTTTADAAAFTTVLSGSAIASATTQELLLTSGPVAARYVRLLAVNNYGSASYVALGELGVVPVASGPVGVSSYQNNGTRPEMLLDNNPATYWLTAGQPVNQYVTLRLAEDGPLVRAVRIQPWNLAQPQVIKDFQVLVSDTSQEDAAFTTVLDATVQNNGKLQEFAFPGGPVHARYLRLVAKNNYGDLTGIRVSTLEVVTQRSDGNIISLLGAAPNVMRSQSPAQTANGATVVASSSASGYSTAASMLDYSNGYFWVTSGTLNQWAIVQLAHAPQTLEGVQVAPRYDCCTDQSVRDFEVWTSTTTTDAGAFTRVLQATVQNNATLQTFLFPAPVQATYLKYVPLSNYGSASSIATSYFDVVSPTAGGVVASSTPVSLLARPELAFDGSVSTAWQPAPTGSPWVKVRLSDGALSRIYAVRISANGIYGPKDFEIRVSSTTADDAAFGTVATGTLAQGATPQQVVFSDVVDARYVEFVWTTSYSPVLLNVAELEVLGMPQEGAALVGTSGGSPGLPAERALELDLTGYGWQTAPEPNQWLKLALPNGEPWLIDRVLLQGGTAQTSPRDFEVQVSTTTTDDAAFRTTFVGTLRNNGALQSFPFAPVQARYVKLLLKTGYGTGAMQLQTFWVVSPQFGGVQAQFLDRSRDPDGAVVAHHWDLGDGTMAGTRDVQHEFPGPGTYDVTLSATDDAGAVGTRTIPYHVFAGPSADFTFSPTVPNEGQTATFVDTSTTFSGSIQTRAWDFPGGYTATGWATTGYAFADNATYPVTLTVSDSRGLFASVTKLVSVANVPPAITMGGAQKLVPGEVWHVGVGIGDAGSVDRTSLTCDWAFGDGETAHVSNCVNANVPHGYANPGDYTAELTVTDKDGGATSGTVAVKVVPAACGLPGGPFIEDPFCGPYSIVDLGHISGVPSNLGGLVFLEGDHNTLLVGGQANTAPGALYATTVNRDAQNHIMGFAGGATRYADAAYNDGGVVYGPEGVLFLARWPVNEFGQTKRGSHVTDKIVNMGPLLGVNGGSLAGLNFVPRNFPGECRLKLLTWAGGHWYSATYAPDGIGTFDITSATYQTTLGGGPEGFLYVPAGSPVFPDFQKMIVAEWSAGFVVVYDVSPNGDPIPGSRQVFLDKYQGPEGVVIDPLTGDLLVVDFAGGDRIRGIRGFASPPAHVVLAPASGSSIAHQDYTAIAAVSDLSGKPKPGVKVAFVVASGPNAGMAGQCAPNVDCTSDATGSVRFTYHGGATVGTDDVTGTFINDSCQVVTAHASVEWLPSPNQQPVASDQTVTTAEDTAAVITLTSTDVDGDALTYAVVTGPAHGSLSGTPPSLTYTPAANYNGPDGLTFKANDGQVDSNVATVTITVTPVNDPPVAPIGPFVTAEDQPLTITASDVEGDALTYLVMVPPSHGTLIDTASGVVYQSAPNYNGPDTFTYKANDGQADSNVAAVTVTVTPANDAPVAAVQAVTTAEDTAVAITLAATDVDGDALTYAVVTGPTHGALSGTPPSLTYTPAANHNGPDSFTFKVNDGQVDSNVATVSITVTPANDPPAANSQAMTTTEDATVAINLTATDVDGDALTYAVVIQPAHGTLSGTAPNLTYAPAANHNGPDGFTFKANDGQVDSNGAMVSITVTAVNDAPVAAAQVVRTAEDSAAAISLTATDVDGDALTYAVVTGPTQGTLSGTPPSLTYTPAANYDGPDSFTFKVNDGQVDSNVAAVSITVTPVNDAPAGNNQAVTTAEDMAVAITLAATDVDGDALTYAVVAGPTHGTLSGTPPSLTYTPTADYSGADSFTFKANDGQADSNVVMVTITATAVNDAPVAVAQTVTTPEDTAAPITLTATDADGDALTYAVGTSPIHGTLSGTPSGLTYTPATNYNGPDSFTFKANDGQVDSNVATVSITVVAVNDAPVAPTGPFVAAEDQALTITASDVDDDTLTYLVIVAPSHGTLAGTASGLVSQPAPNYNGPDTFSYKANDGQADSNVAMVSITVTPVNDPPVAIAQAVMTAEDTGVAITLSATDVEGDPLTYGVVTGPSHGALSGTPPSVTYTPAANYSGPDSFTFTANDGQVDSNVATVSIMVTGSGNHPPICATARADQGSLWPPNHKLRPIQILGVTDPDGDAVSLVATAVFQDEAVEETGDRGDDDHGDRGDGNDGHGEDHDNGASHQSALPGKTQPAEVTGASHDDGHDRDDDGGGDGETSPDAVLQPLRVRAERSGHGDGRVYHISFTATDARGASCIGMVLICVPHDQNKPCVDGGPLFDSTQQPKPREDEDKDRRRQ